MDEKLLFAFTIVGSLALWEFGKSVIKYFFGKISREDILTKDDLEKHYRSCPIRIIDEEIKTIKQRQLELREKMPIEYVRNEIYRDDVRDIKDKINKLFDKVDELVREKQDKNEDNR